MSRTDKVAPRTPCTPQPVRVMPEMRLEHCLHAAHIERKASFHQHLSLDAKVEGILGLGQLLLIFQFKWRTPIVHRKPFRSRRLLHAAW